MSTPDRAHAAASLSARAAPPPGSPNLDIRKKCLDITLDLITPRNISEVVHALKKEVSRSKAPAGSDDEANADRSAEYNELLIGAIHACAVKFPEVAQTVVPVLMEFLADSHQASAVDVALFVREIIEVHTQLRPSVIAKALEMFGQITSPRVLRICLWLLGEYCGAADEVAAAFTAIKGALGKLPLIPAAGEEEVVGALPDTAAATTRRAAGAGPAASQRTTVLADGTYGIASSEASKPRAAAASAAALTSGRKLRELIVGGDFFLASVAAASLTKLALRSREHVSDERIANLVTADVMAILIAMMRLGTSRPVEQRIDADSAERISACLMMLSRPGSDTTQLWLHDCHDAFAAMLKERKAAEESEEGEGAPAEGKGGRGAGAKGKALSKGSKQQPDIAEVRQVDAILNLRQLRPNGAADVDMDDDDLAAGADSLEAGEEVQEDFAQRLKRVTQLTVRRAAARAPPACCCDLPACSNRVPPPASSRGVRPRAFGPSPLPRSAQGMSDPVYAEAFVTVHQYDIVLDVLIINQSAETMANLCLELATVGDLKLCERPQSYTLQPGESRSVRANIKVASTETGIVFGSIVYDATGPLNAERTCIVLHDIHIDIMDYISPAPCSDLAFRAMWAEFEWENKVSAGLCVPMCRRFLTRWVGARAALRTCPPCRLTRPSVVLCRCPSRSR